MFYNYSEQEDNIMKEFINGNDIHVPKYIIVQLVNINWRWRWPHKNQKYTAHFMSLTLIILIVMTKGLLFLRVLPMEKASTRINCRRNVQFAKVMLHILRRPVADCEIIGIGIRMQLEAGAGRRWLLLIRRPLALAVFMEMAPAERALPEDTHSLWISSLICR